MEKEVSLFNWFEIWDIVGQLTSKLPSDDSDDIGQYISNARSHIFRIQINAYLPKNTPKPP
jgi:hypothetical protein